MSKNHMAEVAKIFGVELGESFKITSGIQDDYQSYYRFTESNGIEISDDGVTWKMTSVATLLKYLLMGDIRIVKLPWKPREGEKYYVPRIAFQPENRHSYYYWGNSGFDIERYKMGIVCKTPEEAIALTKKMLAVAKEVEANG